MDTAAFRAACAELVPDDELEAIDAVLDNREAAAGGEPAMEWWSREVQLRNAVTRVRAKARGTDAGRFLQPHEGFAVWIEKAVTDAFTRLNPLEREMELDRIRRTLADELALSDPFGFPGLLAFAVNVRIAERWAHLNEDAGKESVEELVQEILTEDREEKGQSE